MLMAMLLYSNKMMMMMMMKVEATPLFNKLSKWLWIYSDRDFGLAGLRIMTSTGQRNFGFYGFTVWNNLPSACHWTLSSGYIFWVTVSDEHRPVLLWHCFFLWFWRRLRVFRLTCLLT